MTASSPRKAVRSAKIVGDAARVAPLPAIRAASARPAQAAVADSDTQRILHHWRDVLPNDRLAHLVKDAIRALDRALQVRLAAHGVSLGHWPYLRVLWEADGLTQRELSREAGVMEPTTFAAMKAMEQRGYVVRRQLADNRRKVHIFLTAKGRALKARLVPLAESVNAIAVRGVSATDVTVTRRTLLAAIENLAREELNAPPTRTAGNATRPSRKRK